MGTKKILWLEDQYEDFSAYRSALFRTGYMVEPVKSVSDAEDKLKAHETYAVIIFDIKVLPGDKEKWLKLDKKKRSREPGSDSYLGIELLRSLFKPEEAEVVVELKNRLDPKKIIVFSIVYNNTIIPALGIPNEQIIYKSNCDLSTLPGLIKEIVKRDEKNP